MKLNKYGFRKKLFPSSFKQDIEVTCIISSGMCVRKSTVDFVGYMKKQLFIDYVDTEWCLRAIQKKCRIFVTPKVKMLHEIGNENIKVWKYRIPIHGPLRRYYRVRNSFYLLRYPHVQKLMAVREILFSLCHQFILILICKERGLYFKVMINAIVDGVKSMFNNID